MYRYYADHNNTITEYSRHFETIKEAEYWYKKHGKKLEARENKGLKYLKFKLVLGEIEEGENICIEEDNGYNKKD